MHATADRKLMSTLTYAAGLVAIVAAIVIAGLFAIKFAAQIVDKHTGTPAVTVDRIEEDEPGWDCTKHGNRKCGDLVEA